METKNQRLLHIEILIFSINNLDIEKLSPHFRNTVKRCAFIFIIVSLVSLYAFVSHIIISNCNFLLCVISKAIFNKIFQITFAYLIIDPYNSISKPLNLMT